jgi:acyl transferase domain-containing protein/thioesterase domain-containing protein/acyl carrier protein
MNPEDEPSSDIAIIGYAARFPGAENASEFWENLCNGVESIRRFSVSQLESVGLSPVLARNPDYVRAGASLTNLDAFDAAFFGLSPREAAIMDPQQRLFMESAWEALEHAGYGPGTFPGSTGVFAGSGANSYLIHNLLSDPDLVEKEGIFLLRHTGNDKDVLATRLSYQMNLRGPSINVQTACSTSLVAVHLACQSLLDFGCDIALAGAVSVEIPHSVGYLYRQNEIQSQDGHCRAFDAKATGTVFGSGLGVVILRRLSEAVAAGDTIHAVIKGTAINNDGNRKVGFFAPSVEGQVDVISEALAVANVDPASVDYVETHGTGTPIGDPIELAALNQVFGNRERDLKIGSVKTNIGHLDTAAGMAGLLKTVMALRQRKIPPTLHFTSLNPLAEAGKLQVVSTTTDWEGTETPRRAGVTSLGIGGTNAHIVLEEAPEPAPRQPSRPARLFTLSAKTAAALEESTHALARHLRHSPNNDFNDVAYTLHVGRSEFAHRRVFVARDHGEALQLSDLPYSSTVVTGKASEQPSVVFLFSGQGTQYCGMGAHLYRTEPVFRHWLDACADLCRPHLTFDLREILYPPKGTELEAARQMKETWNAQPILFALEYALAQLWISWGVVPDKLIGHSLGEYTAACLAGIFTLEDALSLVCARGNLMRKTSEGAMLAIAEPEAAVATMIKGNLSLAAVNSPGQCVVSGPTSEILALSEQLRKRGVACHRLETSHAFHSESIERILGAFVELVSQKKMHPPQIPMISNVTGAWLTDQEATDPVYWGRHFRETVRFARGLDVLTSDPGVLMLEVGPGDTLCSLGRQTEARSAHCFFSLPRAAEKTGDLSTMLYALGGLWVNGVAIDWNAFHAHEQRHRVPLPTYPFQRKKFWMGPKIGANWISDTMSLVDDWFYRPLWKSAPLPNPIQEPGPWLVLCDASPASEALASQLRKQGAQVTTVFSGDAFEPRGEDACVMNVSSEGDYALLLSHLARQQRTPRYIVHLWGLEPDAPAEDRCFQSLVYLMKEWGSRHPDQPLAIIALSHRSVSLRGEQVLHPYGSLLAGPCRVGPLEYPNVHCRQVDVDSIDPDALARVILGEGEGKDEANTGTSLVVYREGARWLQDVEPFHLQQGTDRLRERGTYLITGGLGALGLAVADWLARTHHARLILVSRNAKEQSVPHEKRFAEWRQLGADVLVCTADVTDRKSLAAALDLAREKFGALNGVIHAAGILRDGIIQLKKESSAQAVMAPKVEGLQILEELTRAEPLDFFALFSSTSAPAPPAGQVDYCAANAFLNAYVQSRPEPARSKFVVIGWGPWAEIGMAAGKSRTAPGPAPFRHPLLVRVDIDTPARTVYSGALSVHSHWVLGEHRFQGGESLLPGTAHLDIAVTALWQKIGRQPIVLEDVFFLAPLRVTSDASCIFQAQLEKTATGYYFSVSSDDVLYVSGRCRPLPPSDLPPRMKIEEILGRCTTGRRTAPKNIRQQGHFDFGPRWQSLQQIAFGPDECLGTVQLPEEYADETALFPLHPALMDIATGLAMYLVPGYEQPGDLLLPFAYKRMALYRPLPPRVYSHAQVRRNTGSELIMFDLTLADEKGEIIAEIEEFTVKRLKSVADLAHLEPVSAPSTAIWEPGDGIPTKEGLEAFQRILKSRPTDIVYVSPTNFSPILAAQKEEAAPLSLPDSDDIEMVLGQLWQRLLGLDQISATTDFFDSGGHSLLAVRLFTEVRKRFNIDFGLSTLFEARTVGALAQLIRQARETDTTQPPANVTPGLIAIRTRASSRKPLFLVHDVGGSVLRYEHLARHFPEDQSIYAIESRGLSGLPTDFSVETMARHYIGQIREQQPQGPYFVAGHSFGGLVAYEIARQLSAQNETLGLVGLIDTYQRPLVEEDATPGSSLPRTDRLPIFKRLLKDTRAVILGHDRIGYLMERHTFMRAWAIKTLYRSIHLVTCRVGMAMPAFLKDVKEANWMASDYFTPGPYNGTVVLFRCQHRLDTDPPDSSRTWQRLTNGGVVIEEVPGDHNSMLREPGVRILAEQILTYLQTEKPAKAEPSVP